MTVFIDIIGFVGGFISAASMVAQVTKTIQHKSLKDFSWLMLSLSWSACFLIFVYGILIYKPAIYLTIFINLICVTILLGYKYKYEKNNTLPTSYHPIVNHPSAESV